MFGRFKKRPDPQVEAVRELLFGDVALADWRPRDGGSEDAEPWASFATARTALQTGDEAIAIDALRRITSETEESRQYLQAWHFLRQLGHPPGSEVAERVHGVVLEVQMKAGLDVLAAYADHTARYVNHAGRLIIWETAEDGVTLLIDDLIHAAQRVADVIGPWEGVRPGPPPRGHVRINILTPSGLHLGEGPSAALGNDPMGRSVISAGSRLMTELIERAEGTTT